jgi:hypothetical protein
MVTCRQPVVIPVKRLQQRALFSHRSKPLFLNVWARETTAPGVALDPPVKETSNQILNPVPKSWLERSCLEFLDTKSDFFAR